MDSNYFSQDNIIKVLSKQNVIFLPYEELLNRSNIRNIKFKKIVLVVDENVYRLWTDKIFAPFKNLGDRVLTYCIRCEERTKTIETACQVYNFLLQNSISRDSLLICVGGGIASDICGYVASTFMRGINYAVVPTTLLGMVDASIGGKNGLNYSNKKNVIGTFLNPCAVIIDIDFLRSLPQREHLSGLGEVCKYTLLSGIDFSNSFSNPNLTIDTIAKCVAIKFMYVNNDFLDKSTRHVLNLGHTIGHSLESVYNYTITHGEAVVNGIYFEAKMSCDFGLTPYSTLENIINFMNRYRFRLLNNLAPLANYPIFDKKQNGEEILLPVLTNIGDCRLVSIKKSIMIEWISNQRF